MSRREGGRRIKIGCGRRRCGIGRTLSLTGMHGVLSGVLWFPVSNLQDHAARTAVRFLPVTGNFSVAWRSDGVPSCCAPACALHVIATDPGALSSMTTRMNADMHVGMHVYSTQLIVAQQVKAGMRCSEVR